MRNRLLAIYIACFALLLSACHSMPEHAKYIPKEATTVVSVDIMGMGKKMAWNAIVGSKIFDEWKARPQQKDAVKGIDNSGIDFMNTLYLYTLKNDAFGHGQSATALAPMGDAAKWEAFLKKNFPEVAIKEQGKRKEAALSEKLYAGWDKDILIVLIVDQPSTEVAYDSTGAAITMPAAIDPTILTREMDRAFNVAANKEQSITGNKHFASLQKEGHDISFWINYDVTMTDMMSKTGNAAPGINLSNALWKDAAFTAGIDFNKGVIKADMKTYMSKELKEISHQLGSTSVDKDMVEKMPADGLDAVGAWHLSPKGLRSALEKMNVLGLANIALSVQNLTVDDILNAFTGDMGIAVNNFKVSAAHGTDTTSGATVNTSINTNADYLFVVGINKKENFNKLLQLAITGQVLQASGNNVYVVKNGGADAPVLVIGDKYAVIGKNAEAAKSYLAAGGDKLPATVKEAVTGHPMGMYVDIKRMAMAIDPGINNGEYDPAIIAEAQKLFESATMSGGEFKNDAFQLSAALNFTNKEENSMLQILNFAIHVSDAKNKPLTAQK